MPTISIPVPGDMHADMKAAIAHGFGQNITDIGRTAIKNYLEALAVQQVLKAQSEPSLSGDLDELSEAL